MADTKNGAPSGEANDQSLESRIIAALLRPDPASGYRINLEPVRAKPGVQVVGDSFYRQSLAWGTMSFSNTVDMVRLLTDGQVPVDAVEKYAIHSVIPLNSHSTTPAVYITEAFSGRQLVAVELFHNSVVTEATQVGQLHLVLDAKFFAFRPDHALMAFEPSANDKQSGRFMAPTAEQVAKLADYLRNIGYVIPDATDASSAGQLDSGN